MSDAGTSTLHGPDARPWPEVALVVGSPRSGTTWLANTLNHDLAYRPAFEPLHPSRVPEAKVFGHLPYLRADDHDEVLVRAAEQFLRGELRNAHVDRYVTMYSTGRVLVKLVRANLMMGWLAEQFPRVRSVLLIRHPCAVAASQLRTGWWERRPDALLDDPRLVEDHLAPFVDLLTGLDDPFDRTVAHWCAEQYVALRDADRACTKVAFYEPLCVSPGEALPPLFAHLGRPFTPGAVRQSRLPSPLARQDAAVRLGLDPVRTWLDRVSDDERRRAVDLLTAFGLDRLYDADPMPKLHADDVFDAVREA